MSRPSQRLLPFWGPYIHSRAVDTSSPFVDHNYNLSKKTDTVIPVNSIIKVFTPLPVPPPYVVLDRPR